MSLTRSSIYIFLNSPLKSLQPWWNKKFSTLCLLFGVRNLTKILLILKSHCLSKYRQSDALHVPESLQCKLVSLSGKPGITHYKVKNKFRA